MGHFNACFSPYFAKITCLIMRLLMKGWCIVKENVTELNVPETTSKSGARLFFAGLAKATVAMAAAVVAGIVIGDQINKHKS